MERLKELIQSEDSDLWDYKEELITLINEAIARQSATSEEVQRAIEELSQASDRSHYAQDGAPVKTLISLATIDLAITALQAYQPWIPVSERLPDQCESYLVVVKEKDQPNDLIHVDVASSYGKYIDDFWDTFNDWKEGQEVHITHWKPLPEPPKGE